MQQFASKGIRRGKRRELGRRIILLHSSWKFVLRDDLSGKDVCNLKARRRIWSHIVLGLWLRK
jgi:hypothetical protein